MMQPSKYRDAACSVRVSLGPRSALETDPKGGRSGLPRRRERRSRTRGLSNAWTTPLFASIILRADGGFGMRTDWKVIFSGANLAPGLGLSPSPWERVLNPEPAFARQARQFGFFPGVRRFSAAPYQIRRSRRSLGLWRQFKTSTCPDSPSRPAPWECPPWLGTALGRGHC